MEPENNSLEQPYTAPDSLSGQPSVTPVGGASGAMPPSKRKVKLFGFNKAAFLSALVVGGLLIAIGGVIAAFTVFKSDGNGAGGPAAENFSIETLSVSGSNQNATELKVGKVDRLAINGQLQVSNTLVVKPTTAPPKPVTGQIYYDSQTNQVYFYNGERFVSMVQTPPVSGRGITVNGTTITNNGVLGINSGSSTLVITNDGQGNYTIVDTSTNLPANLNQGTTNRIAVFTGANTLGDSALSQNGTTVVTDGALTVSQALSAGGNLTVGGAASVAGNLGVTGATTLGGTLAVSGAATFGNGLSVNGPASVIGSLTVDGAGSFTGNLTVNSSLFTNSIANQTSGSDLAISAGSDNLVFTAGGRTFIFPTSGPASQTICTTGISCASGGGQAVLIQPGAAQTDTGSGESIFVNNTGGGTLIRLQGSGTDRFVVSNTGALTATSGRFTSLGTGFVLSNGTGNLSSGTVDRNSNTYFTGTLSVTNGGTGAGSFTTNGIVFGNGTSALQVTSAAANSILATNGSNVPSLVQTLPTAVQGNITGTGVLVSGSIASGFGTISTANNISTTAALQGGSLSVAGGAFSVNGSGAITSATGITSSGAITFSGLTAGILRANSSGVISSGSVALGTETTGNYVASLGSLLGLSTTGNSGAGSTPTLSVIYGSSANTAVQGNTTLACAAGTGNLSGGGNTITLGMGGSCGNLTIVDSPTFAGTVSVQGSGGIVVGVPNTTDGQIQLATAGSAFLGTFKTAALGQATTFILPDPGAASATICLSTGNCAGVGGGVSTPGGTTNRLAKFTGPNTIGDSLITDNGSFVGVNTSTNNGQLSVVASGTQTGFFLQGAATGTSPLFVIRNNGSTGNFLELQNSVGTPLASIDNTGNLVAASGRFTNLGTGLVQSNSSGNLSSGAVDRNSSAFFNTVLSVTNGGTGAGSFTSNGIVYGNGTSALQVTSAAANSVLVTNGSNVPSLSQTLPSAVQGNITATGALASGSITTGFGSISTGNNISTTAGLQGGTLNIGGGTFTVNGTGAITAATGVTSSGTITFSSLGAGVLHANSSGVISSSAVVLGTDTTGNYVANLGTLTGLSVTGNSGAGSTPALSVIYGSSANTAVQGNTTLVCASGTGNLTGGGNSITLGSGGSCGNISIVNNPTFSGNVSVQGSGGLTVGVANTTDGVINFATAGSSNLGTLKTATLGQATTFTLPDPGTANATICLTTGNCAGVGGGITGSGTNGRLAKFNGSGSITDSSLSESGTNLTASGTLTIQGASALTLGTASGNTGSIAFKNSANNFTLTLLAGATGSNFSLTLPTTPGNAGDCLQSNGSGVLSFNACTGGAGGGVTSLNGLIGVLTVANASASGSTITLDDASTSTKGIARFNATNFVSASGEINTIQDIAVSSAPTFNGLTLTNALTVANGGTGAGSFTSNGILYGNGTGALQVTSAAANSILATDGSSVPALTQVLPTAVQGNITSTGALTSGSIASGFGTISTGNNITTSAALQGGSLSVAGGGFAVNTSGAITAAASITTSGTLSVQGAGGATIGVAGSVAGALKLANAGNGNLGTLSIANLLGQATSYILPDPGTGTATICLSTGNCAGAGGGVTTTGGTQNYVTKYNNAGANQISNSQLYDDGSFVGINTTTNSGQLSIVTSGAKTGFFLQGAATGTDSLFVIKNNGSTGNFLELQDSTGTPLASIDSTGNLVAVGGQFTALGTGLVQSNASGNLSSGAVDRNSSAFFNTVLSVANGGTGAGSFTANGILYGNGTGALQVTSAAANSVLVTNGSNVPSLSQTLPSAVQGNITATGALASGSITTGFGAISTGNNITTSAALQGGSLSVAGGTFTVNGTGAITAATGITSSGTITFSSLGAGILHANSSGVISSSAVVLGTDTTGNYVANLGTLTGLTTTGNTGAGSTPTLSVIYGSSANTAVQGNTTLTCASGTGNLTGGGNSITLGSGGSCNNISIVNNPTFSGNVTVQGSGGLTVGIANSVDGLINLANSGSTHLGTLKVAALGQATTFTLPDPGASSATICLSIGNCAGSGGGVTTPGGTAGQIAFFNGSQTIQGNNNFTWDNTNKTLSLIGVTGSSGTVLDAVVGSGLSTRELRFGASEGLILQANDWSATVLAIQDITDTSVFVVKSDGMLGWGGGSGTDTTLYRSSAGVLKTDGSLEVAGSIVNNSFNPQSGVTYSFATASAGAYEICTTAGNCAGTGGGVTTPGGTTNKVAKFTGAQTLGDSLITDDGNFVGINTSTNSGQLSVVTSGAKTGFFLQGAATGTDPLFVIRQNGSTGRFIELQNSVGTILAAINDDGKLEATGARISSLAGDGLVMSNSVGDLSSGMADRNDSTFFSNALTVANGGTGAGSFTSNGILYGNGTGALQVTSAAANSVLVTDGSSIPSLSQTLPSAVQGNITATGALTSGSIASGFGTISTGSNITTTAALQGGTLSIGGGTFTVNGAGAITAATGITSSGTITFSNLGAGVLHANSSGVISSSAVVLGTDTSGSYVANIGTLTGLTTTGNSGAGSTPTLSVIYGSSANTAVQGNTTLTCASGTGNLTGGGNSITLGSGGSCNNISIVNNPTFSGNVTVQGSGGLTVGVAGTTEGLINLANGVNSNLGTLKVATLGQGTTYTLPDPGTASATICLSTGNCAGSGGGITGSGTSGRIAKFNGSGSITDSTLSESGSNLTASGTLTIQGASALTLGTASTNTGSIAFKNSANNFTLNLLAGATASNFSLTLPTTPGNAGDCLQSNGSGVLSFNACTGGAGGGVTSLNGLIGVLTVANASASGSTITLDDASTSAKGIAQFNSTNFSASSGVINTIQDIAVSSAPTFNGLTLTNALTVANGGTGAGSFTANGILYGNGTGTLQVTGSAANSILATNGSSVPTLTQTLPTAVQGNITSTGALTAGSIASGFGTISTANNITTTAAVQSGTLSVQGAGGATIGVGGSVTGALKLANAANSNLGTLQVASLGQATTFTLPDPGASSATICLSTGNCASSGGGVTTSGGTAGQLAFFSASQAIQGSNSLFWDTANSRLGVGTNTPGYTLDVAGDINTTGIYRVNGTQIASSNLSDSSNIAKLNANQTFTAPQSIQTSANSAITLGVTSTITSTSGTFKGGLSNITLNPSTNATTTATGFDAGVIIQGTGNITNINGQVGVKGNVVLNGSGTVDIAAGMAGIVTANNGVITNGSAVAAQLITNGGTITNGGGLTVATPIILSGSIGTAYGINISAQKITGVTTGYGVYQAGANDLNYFAGKTGIGAVPTTTGSALQVSGGVQAVLSSSSAWSSALSGTFVYDSTAGKFYLYDGSAKKEICNLTDGCGSGPAVTLQSAYNSSTNPEIVVDGTRGALTVRDASTPIGANLLEVQSNNGSTTYLGVTTSGISVGGNITATGTYNTNTFTSSALTFGAAGAAAIQSASGQALSLDSGTTGALDIGTSANAKTITIGNGTGATSVVINAGTGALSIGTNAVARTITIGNTTGASALNLRAGTGNFTIDGAATTTYSLGASATSGTITIGGTAQTGTIGIGTGTGAQAINLGTGGTGAKTVTVGSTASTGATTIQAGTGALTIQNQGTGAINIANNAVNSTINIGKTGSTANTTTINLGTSTGAAQTINAGSSHASSAVTLQGGATSLAVANAAATVSAGTGVLNINSTSGSGFPSYLRFQASGTTYGYLMGDTDGLHLNISNGSGIGIGSSDTLTVKGTSVGIGLNSVLATPEAKLDVRGTTKVKVTDAAAFKVQNASDVDLFNIDTSTSKIQVGASTADATGVLLVLDTKNTSGDPTGSNGAMYYNSNLGKFRCYQGGAWVDCITAADGTGGDAYLANSQTFTGNNTFTGTMLLQNASNSANAFRVQNAAGANIVSVDTSTNKLEVTGSINLKPAVVPSALTATEGTSGVLTGSYSYRVTFVTAGGESAASDASNNVNPASQRVDLTSIPTGTSGMVTARKIYRAASLGNYYLLTTINDNTTTTYSDNTPDGSLGSDIAPADDSTAILKIGGVSAIRLGPVGASNSWIGLQAGSANTGGMGNTGVGAAALSSNTLGNSNTALGNSALSGNTTGNFNVAVGVNALQSATTGSSNVAVGSSAMFFGASGGNNTALGSSAGFLNSTGANNTFIGYGAGLMNNGSGNVFIGNEAGSNESGSDKLYIANSSTSTPLIGGDFSASTVDINGALKVKGSSATAYQIQNSSGENLLTADTSTHKLTLKASSTQSGNLLEVKDNSDQLIFSVNRFGGFAAANSSSVGTMTGFGGRLSVATAGAGTVGIVVRGHPSQTADLQQWQVNGGGVVASIGATGAATFRNTVDSTTAFRVQNNAGDAILTVDTDNDMVMAGNGVGLGNFGMIVQNGGGISFYETESSLNTIFNIGYDGDISWGNGTGSPDVYLSRSAANKLQVTGSLDVSQNLSVSGTALFKTNSASAFDVQNASSQSLFKVDTSANQVVLGNLGNCGKLYTDAAGILNCASTMESQINHLQIHGHSLAAGLGASNADYRWTSRLAAMLGASEDNKAVSGAVAAYHNMGGHTGGWANVMNEVRPTRTAAPYVAMPGLGILAYGMNDIAAYDTADVDNYQEAMRAIISRYRAAALFEDTDASMTFSQASGGSNWTHLALGTDLASGGTAKMSTSNGNTYTIVTPSDFPGGTIAIGLAATTGQGAVHTYTLDGSPAGSVDTRNKAVNSYNNAVVKRITVPSGSHTIVGTISNIVSATYVDYWQIEAPTPRPVAVISSARTAPYSTGSMTDSDIAAFNSALQSVVNEFDSAVKYIDIDTEFYAHQAEYLQNTPASGHPNDLGQAAIADVVYKAIRNWNLSGMNVSMATTPSNLNTINNLLFRNNTNSTTAFRIQNAGGTDLFTADTTNMTVTVGNSTNGIVLSGAGLELKGTARNAKKIILTPEYAGAVLDGTGTGTMTAAYDSTARKNYYKWTTTQVTSQTFDVVISMSVPSDWSAWATSNAFSVESWTSNTTNSTGTATVISTNGTTDVNAVSITPGSTSTWTTTNANLTSSSIYVKDNVMIIKLRMTANNGSTFQLGNVTLSYLSKF